MTCLDLEVSFCFKMVLNRYCSFFVLANLEIFQKSLKDFLNPILLLVLLEFFYQFFQIFLMVSRAEYELNPSHQAKYAPFFCQSELDVG